MAYDRIVSVGRTDVDSCEKNSDDRTEDDSVDWNLQLRMDLELISTVPWPSRHSVAYMANPSRKWHAAVTSKRKGSAGGRSLVRDLDVSACCLRL